jgi:hypothetical protein
MNNDPGVANAAVMLGLFVVFIIIIAVIAVATS